MGGGGGGGRGGGGGGTDGGIKRERKRDGGRERKRRGGGRERKRDGGRSCESVGEREKGEHGFGVFSGRLSESGIFFATHDAAGAGGAHQRACTAHTGSHRH